MRVSTRYINSTRDTSKRRRKRRTLTSPAEEEKKKEEEEEEEEKEEAEEKYDKDLGRGGHCGQFSSAVHTENYTILILMICSQLLLPMNSKHGIRLSLTQITTESHLYPVRRS